MAGELTAQRGLANVEIVTAGARRTGLPSGSFDFVHARTLLVNGSRTQRPCTRQRSAPAAGIVRADAGDEAGRRLAALQLWKLKAATQV